jgi:hypothetical protein
MSEQDLLKHLRMRPYSNPSFWMLEAADEIERLKSLAIRAWHSFRSGGLTQADEMPHCLSDADMAELKRLADADAAKLIEQAPRT